ncbi:MAG: hypothetical protein J7485_03440 [Sphingobium sp.]|nr:hypothetical protein [Sphingobium sp.]
MAEPLLGQAQSARPWSVTDNLGIDHVAVLYVRDEHGKTRAEQFVYDQQRKAVAYIVESSDIEQNLVRSTLRVDDVAELRTFGRTGKPVDHLLEFEASSSDSQPAISSLSWSSDGRRLYFLFRANGQNQLYQWDSHDVRPKAITEATRDVIDYAEIDENTFIVFDARDARGANRPVEPEKVTGRSLISILEPTYARISSSRGTILAPQDLLLVDRTTGKISTLGVKAFPYLNVVIAPGGSRFAFVEPFSAKWEDGCWVPGGDSTPAEPLSGQIAVYDRVSGSVSHPFQGPTAFGLSLNVGHDYLVWSSDGQRAMALSTFTQADRCSPERQRSAMIGTYQLDFGSGGTSLIQRFPFNRDGYMPRLVEGAGWTSDGEISLRTAPERYPAFFTRSAQHEPALPPAVESYRKGVDGQYVQVGSRPVAEAGTPASPILEVCQELNVLPAICISDGRRGKRTYFDLSARVRGAQIDRGQKITWIDKAGTTWSGVLLLPERRTTALPLILQTHGVDSEDAFFAEGASTSAFPGRAALERGYAVLNVTEPGFTSARIDEPRRVLDGYSAAIDMLAKQGVIDRRRVGLIGWSRTAYYVEYILSHAPSLACAAVVSDGLDYGAWQHAAFQDLVGNGVVSQYDYIYGGDIEQEADVWLREMPDLNVSKVVAPTRIEAYGMLSVLHGWGFYAGLRGHGKHVELVYYPSDIHSLFRPSDRLASLSGTLDWFDRWMPKCTASRTPQN